MEKIMRIVNWVMDLRIVRAFQRYGAARGALLSGGIAYSAIFAIAGALVIGLTIFSYILGGNEALKTDLFDQINSFLPGILQTDGSPDGLLDPNNLIVEDPINIATIISLLVTLWSSLALMTGLRTSIQAMFGISRIPMNFVVGKLLDLSGFVVIALGALAGVIMTAGAAFFSDVVLDFLGLPDGVGVLAAQIGSFAITILIDVAIFAYLFRFLGGARPPKKDLLFGAGCAAIGSTVLRVLGTGAVSSVSDKPLLAPFAAIVTLLLWVNLLARLTLVCAAFTANPPAPGMPTDAQLVHALEVPNYVTKSRPDTLEWTFDPVTGVVVPDPLEDKEKRLTPPWDTLRGKRAQAKLARIEAKYDRAREEFRKAKEEYHDAAWTAYRKSTVPSTSSQGSAIDIEVLGAKAAKQRQKEDTEKIALARSQARAHEFEAAKREAKEEKKKDKNA